jgi:hypothetical protein
VEALDHNTSSSPPLLIRNDRHDITETLLKVALGTISTHTLIMNASLQSQEVSGNVYVCVLILSTSTICHNMEYKIKQTE